MRRYSLRFYMFHFRS